MAYTLLVGKSNKMKDRPAIVGSMEFEPEYAILCRLANNRDVPFLDQLTNHFDDATFTVAALTKAQSALLDLITAPLEEDERTLLHKCIAVVAYELSRQMPLYGVAD